MIRLALVCAIGFGVWWFLYRSGCGTSGAIACPPAAIEEGVGVELDAREVCPKSGYLCFQREGGFQVARFSLEKGKLRVRVRLPEFLDEARGKAFRDAAIEGIKVWDGHPFPIVIDAGKYTIRPWDIAVVWQEGDFGDAGGRNVGRYDIKGKRVEWTSEGLSINVPPLVGRFGSALAGAQGVSLDDADAEFLARVKAVATHEMGHALGLAHSDRRDDIMYFQLATDARTMHASARDFETVEALYALPNGAAVR